MSLWVFAYGSLLWNPGFTPVETVRAELRDFHRCFSLRSVVHRGTVDCPGLVLALEDQPGARCTGMALRVAPTEADVVLADLRARELVTDAYKEARLPLALSDGRTIEGLTYVIRRGHAQHAQHPLEEQAQIIARARGGRGPNCDYLWSTEAHLRELGVQDADMAWLAKRVRDILQ